ncbi:TniQ family protein [Arthrobacter sp. UNC362MFTsu5.1]|uniref:TniQ family protein n=1 Tax=Arthrobacter sp. UNC362MFTsu5.1 TaxID=1449044 RepID=UPI0009DE2457
MRNASTNAPWSWPNTSDPPNEGAYPNGNCCDHATVTGPRRWPVHPAPIDGETFSSWLHRIADCYGTDLNVLADDLGFTLVWRPPEDIDVAASADMIEVLTERTGVTPDRLRQTSVAGWVPWRFSNSEEVQQSEQRTCRFPGCVRPAVSTDIGTGRPPPSIAITKGTTGPPPGAHGGVWSTSRTGAPRMRNAPLKPLVSVRQSSVGKSPVWSSTWASNSPPPHRGAADRC